MAHIMEQPGISPARPADLLQDEHICATDLGNLKRLGKAQLVRRRRAQLHQRRRARGPAHAGTLDPLHVGDVALLHLYSVP